VGEPADPPVPALPPFAVPPDPPLPPVAEPAAPPLVPPSLSSLHPPISAADATIAVAQTKEFLNSLRIVFSLLDHRSEQVLACSGVVEPRTNSDRRAKL
jgi:hypothetical protein